MKNFSIIILSGLLLFVSSCVKLESDFVVADDSYSLKLNISQPGSQTRGASEMETMLNETYVFLFDVEGHLELRQHWDVCPKEVTFRDLTRGAKKLFVLANYKAHVGFNPIMLDTLTSYSTLQELQLHYKVGADALTSIPMHYMTDLQIPLANQEISVDLDRMLARIFVTDDIVAEGFTADSVCFFNLSHSLYPWADDPRIVADTTQVLHFTSDTRHGVIYMLPASGNQITYETYGKNEKGVTKVYKGTIRPAVGSNHNYSLSLLTGELDYNGDMENFRVTVDPSIGSYSEQDSVLHLKHRTGAFSIRADSYDALGISMSSNWLTATPSTRASKDEYAYSVSFSDFRPEIVSDDDVRRDTILFYNKLDPTRSHRIFVEQEKAKYYVVVVSGQSNASGSDFTVFTSPYDDPNSRVYQFGQRGVLPPIIRGAFSSASTLNVIPLLYMAHNLDGNFIPLAAKGIHLSLGKAILPHIPDDYDVLVISATYTGSGFGRGDVVTGEYDPVNMRHMAFHRPSQGPGAFLLRANEGVVYNTLVDRTERGLKLNKHNKFVGVVWSQGESDHNSATKDTEVCYPRFLEFAQAFFDDINNKIDPSQLPGGSADKHLWFAIDCTGQRKNWHRENATIAASHVFGRYKVWNPDAYIPLPLNIDIQDDSHFGKNAFPRTIVPLVIERMLYNGVIGEQAGVGLKYFVRQITESDALVQSGNLTDADIQNGLDIYLPFNQADSVTKNLAVSAATVTNQGMALGDAKELKDINGGLRQRLVLHLDGSSGSTLQLDALQLNSWSVSFMFRRTNGADGLKDKYLLRVPGTTIGLFSHQYLNESEGGYLGLAFQPWKPTFDRLHSVVFRLNDASYVRSHEEWIHYAVSYNHLTRVCRIYANGEMVMEQTLAAVATAPNIQSLVLGDALSGVAGQFFDLYLWRREVSSTTLFKTYIMSYYGITKDADAAPNTAVRRKSNILDRR